MAVKKKKDSKQKKKTDKTETSASKQKKSKKPAPFPVVGIGASAGGLEAISNLLHHLAPDLGMAYVIIQHLSPDHKSILPEILQKRTPMKVQTVKNGMHVAPNTVFVIPPNTYMSIVDGKLALSPRTKTDAGHRSIDFFLNALARIYRHNAIAIILSGTAYDGTAGIQAIKINGGITFAQDDSAKFPDMPFHATDTGFVDFVLSPEKIAQKLGEISRNPIGLGYFPARQTPGIGDTDWKKIYRLLYNKKGVDFSHYKKTTINRRILRRITLTHLKSLDEYIKFLTGNDKEIELLYKDMLINVTSFFRDNSAYQFLIKKILPAIFKGRKNNMPVRIWIPACASGEEAYSVAICLFEFMKAKNINIPIQLFATDLNENSIEKARLGIYTASSVATISRERLTRFFNRVSNDYQIIKAIRDICIFAPHNLLTDPPFSRVDIISCQNVMIYLEANSQKKILQTFHYALQPNGFLILGKSETTGSTNELFEHTDKELKIYTKKEAPPSLPQLDFTRRLPKDSFPATDEYKALTDTVTLIDIEKETDKLLLSEYVPASVVINKDMQITRFQGATSTYLEPASGKATLHLFKMLREELLFEVINLVNKSKKEKKPFKKKGIKLGFEDNSKDITVEVVPIRSTSKDPYFLVIFKEQDLVIPQGAASNTKRDSVNRRISELQKELKENRQQIKIMSEEFEATREELQSANEEVLSSNEELQSINEEMETSKEELQSSNEELITMNEELYGRNNELKEARDYALAVFETIHESLIVLNPDLTVKTANKAFYTLFKTSSQQTLGHFPFGQHKGQWLIDELRKQLADMLHKDNSYKTFEVSHDFTASDNKILLFHAMRMSKDDNNKNSILLAIQDITQQKTSEDQLRQSEENFRLLVQNSADIITVSSVDGTIIYQSDSVRRILGYSPEETKGKNIVRDSFVHPDDTPAIETMFRNAQDRPQENVFAEFRLRHKDGSYRVIEAICINQLSDRRINGIIANYRDITEKKNLERQKEDFIAIASHELKTPVTSIKAYTQILEEKLLELGDTQSADMTKKMDAQIDRLTHLIVDLLDTTKIVEGQLQLNESLFDITGLIKEKVEEMQRTTRRHKIITRLKKGPKIWGDEERIGQVLINLLSNAIKYSPDANKINISSSFDEEKITICVRDFGIGVAPELQEKVFERFFRSHDPSIQTYPGLGLGLFIAAGIIKRKKGNIWLKSEKGKGSSFYFSLPIKRR